MAETQKRSIDKKESSKVQLALTLDMFVNGEDRLAGYVVLSGGGGGKVDGVST